MRIFFGLTTLVAAGVTVGATPLAAQAGATRVGAATQRVTILPLPADGRRGFWLGAGIGPGNGSLHCGICNDERDRGTAGYIRLGTTLNRKLLVGVEGGAWQREGEEGKRRLLSLTAGGWWYPNERHGYFVRFGAGLTRWRAWDGGEDAVTSAAIGLIAGVGYEVRLNPALSIVPYVNALGTSSGALWLESRDDVSFERRRLPAGGHALLIQIGVGITRH
ncbi:MAG: hypothetical protein HOP28_05825 [Gemmatimonadales bacterium]|nr:hypothetical protein [Gemmatimonadales bacterium]